MLDPLTLPLLLKSIDFIYAEYSKLLDERRKRREATRDETQETIKETPAIKPISGESIQDKVEVLKIPVDSTLWQQEEEHIAHLVALLEIHYANYRLLSKQYAQWTAALVPPVIANSLANEEKEIEENTQKLSALISKIYSTDL